jgi:hypothetical protein
LGSDECRQRSHLRIVSDPTCVDVVALLDGDLQSNSVEVVGKDVSVPAMQIVVLKFIGRRKF